MYNVLDVLKQKTRKLKYVLFEVKTKYCNEIMGVLPQIKNDICSPTMCVISVELLR